jgi:RNA polymerase sigma-70 factor (ECF subfamily)
MIHMDEKEQRKRFLELFLAHRDRLYAFIRVMVRDPDLTEDMLQEVSLVLWEKLDTFQDGTSFAAWSRQVALNKIRNERRRLAKAPLPLSEDASAALAEAFDRLDDDGDEWTRALRRCMERLSPQVRSVLELRYFTGMGLEDIAKKLGRTAAGVNSGLCKARKFLEGCVLKALGREVQYGR